MPATRQTPVISRPDATTVRSSRQAAAFSAARPRRSTAGKHSMTSRQPLQPTDKNIRKRVTPAPRARGKENAVARGNASDRASSKAVEKVNAFQG